MEEESVYIHLFKNVSRFSPNLLIDEVTEEELRASLYLPLSLSLVSSLTPEKSFHKL